MFRLFFPPSWRLPMSDNAFPSLRPFVAPGSFMLQEGFTDAHEQPPQRILRLAILRGLQPSQEPGEPKQRYPATRVGTLFVSDNERADRIVIEENDLVVAKEATLLYTGANEIDAWCRDLEPERQDDAVRVFRLIAALGMDAKSLPYLVGIVYRKRYEFVIRLEEILSTAPEERQTIPEIATQRSAHIVHQLLREADHLGLRQMVLVQRLAGILGSLPPPPR